MTIEIALTAEQAGRIPAEGDDLVVFVTPEGRHVGRLDRQFSEQDRRMVEAIVERRKHRDPNRKCYTTEEVLEMIREFQPS